MFPEVCGVISGSERFFEVLHLRLSQGVLTLTKVR